MMASSHHLEKSKKRHIPGMEIPMITTRQQLYFVSLILIE